MLIAGIFTDSIKNMFEYGIFSLLLYIDSVVYKIVSMLFSVFYSIAELQILNNDVYEAIADRVYLLVGVIALFAITVSFVTTAPRQFKSTNSEYSIPEPKVPDAVITGFLNSTPAILTFVFKFIFIPVPFCLLLHVYTFNYDLYGSA